ncbi:hypothetical protein V6N11_052771 [Hibiscus sabdariffa]|uniref:Uncharacterized protein n=1 Tax=Hibiscus sabdariffa TaxID=183260 RepID=A0ABR2UB15_9ROSI
MATLSALRKRHLHRYYLLRSWYVHSFIHSSISGSPVTWLDLAGHKVSWPELLGKKQAEAQATIQRDNPQVTVVILSPGRARFFDFCCNRVYLSVDGSGIVTKTPTVG